MKNSKKLLWGILGAGEIADQFLASFPDNIDGEVAAIASRSLSKARLLATKYNVPRFYGNYKELIHNFELDIIYIATINHVHFDQAKMCLLAGKAVLCEKPLTIEYQKTQELIKIAKENNLFLMEAIRTPFLPHITKLKEILEKQNTDIIKVGQLNFGFNKNPNTERLFNTKFGGGALFDMGVYGISTIIYLFGYPSEIHAVSNKSKENEVDSFTTIIFKYRCGRIIKMSFSICFDLPLHFILLGSDISIQIFNKWWREPSLQLRMVKQIKNFEFDSFTNFSAHMINHVSECIKSGKKESNILSFNKTLETAKITNEIFTKI